MTVRQARNEIFSDRIYTFGKAVRRSLTGSQMGKTKMAYGSLTLKT